MKFALDRYDLTVALASPEDPDIREQQTYRCEIGNMANNTTILRGLILEVATKLDIRIAGPAEVEPVASTGYVTEEDAPRGQMWPRG